MAEKSLRDAFRQLMMTEQNRDGFLLAQIRVAWPKLFGKNIARHTRELMVRKNKLYIYVNAATVRAQLMMVRQGIKDRLNEELGGDYIHEVMIK